MSAGERWLLLLALCAGCSSHNTYESGSGGAAATGGGAGSAGTAGLGGDTSAGGTGSSTGGSSGGDPSRGGSSAGDSSAGGSSAGSTTAGAGGDGADPIERIGSSTAFITDMPSVTVNLPGSVAADDLVLLTLYMDDGADAVPVLDDDFGFTMTAPLGSAGCGSFVVWYGYRVARDGDPTSYNFTFTVGEPVLGVTGAFAVYRGVDPSSPFTSQQARGLEETDFSLPDLGPQPAGAEIVAFFVDGFNELGSWEPPPGMNEFLDAGWLGAFEAHLDSAGPAPLGSAVSATNGCGAVFAAALAPR